MTCTSASSVVFCFSSCWQSGRGRTVAVGQKNNWRRREILKNVKFCDRDYPECVSYNQRYAGICGNEWGIRDVDWLLVSLTFVDMNYEQVLGFSPSLVSSHLCVSRWFVCISAVSHSLLNKVNIYQQHNGTSFYSTTRWSEIRFNEG